MSAESVIVVSGGDCTCVVEESEADVEPPLLQPLQLVNAAAVNSTKQIEKAVFLVNI